MRAPHCLPSPISRSNSSRRWWVLITSSVIPCPTRFVMPYARIGMPHTGMSGLGRSAPSAPSRVESPAHSSIARVIAHATIARIRALDSQTIMSMRIAPLDRSQLAAAELVLADACAFDRATEVAEEKLFESGPNSVPLAFGAWRDDGDHGLIGVAAVAGRFLRVLAVVPGARGRGIGSALLAACENAARATGETRLRTLDEPGNYLAPGIDVRNQH